MLRPDVVEGTIRTFTGKLVNISNPRPEMFNIEDIAHALSQVCRFGGHTYQFFSVAQHSVDVAKLVARDRPEYALFALLHDATEAYIQDIPRPLKPLLVGYKEIEDRLSKVIYESFGLSNLSESTYAWEVTKGADTTAALDELDRVIYGKSKVLYQPAEAEQVFLDYYESLIY